MAKLPARGSGPISMKMITDVFGKDAPDDAINEYYRAGGKVPGQNTNIPASGKISWADFFDGRTNDPQALEWGPGTYQIKIPDYGVSISMELWGGGGGPNGGGAGGNTTFHTLVAYGGSAGAWVYEAWASSQPSGGNGGSASGGDVNGTGGKGGMGYVYGRDPAAPNGKGEGHPARGAGATPPYAFNAANKWWLPGGGGGGGWCKKTWNFGDAGAPEPNSTITLVVGDTGGGDGVGGYAKMAAE